ncbi:MAG: anti-sigma factor [Alphaproteobacteria bacterium]
MIPADRQARDAHAAEYVLGTLDEDERAEMMLALRHDAGLRDLVAAWEDRLAPLADGVTPVPPSAAAWPRLAAATVTRAAGAGEPVAERLRRRLRGWRLATAGAGALAAALAVYIGLGVPGLPWREPAVLVAVLQQGGPSPAWLIEARAGDGAASVRPVATPALAEGRDFELWAIIGGDAPVSLGVIDRAAPTRVRVPDVIRARLGGGVTLAVSIEPRGGSPTGAPTGPVVFTGTLAPRG